MSYTKVTHWQYDRKGRVVKEIEKTGEYEKTIEYSYSMDNGAEHGMMLSRIETLDSKAEPVKRQSAVEEAEAEVEDDGSRIILREDRLRLADMLINLDPCIIKASIVLCKLRETQGENEQDQYVLKADSVLRELTAMKRILGEVVSRA